MARCGAAGGWGAFLHGCLAGAGRPPFPLDVGAVLGPLRRGAGDPALPAGGRASGWRPTRPAAPARWRCAVMTARSSPTRGVPARAWLLDGLPALLGADDVDEFQRAPPAGRSRRGGVRRGCGSARPAGCGTCCSLRSWSRRSPATRRGARGASCAAGSVHPHPGRRPPGCACRRTRRRCCGSTDWEWHRAGLDGARRRALIAAAQVAHRLERAVELRGEEGRALLRKVPGIGVWTAAEVAQRAWGDADAVSVGDFHIPSVRRLRAARAARSTTTACWRCWRPYAPHRHRAVRYVEASGFRRPRFGPRYATRDYRAL